MGNNAAGARLVIPRWDWRHDIPFWTYRLQPMADDGAILAGYLEGNNEILLLRRPNMGEIGIVPHVYAGKCQFTQAVNIPESEQGKVITFCFGGWNDEDWRSYQWKLNGVVLYAGDVPRGWHEPVRVELVPGSREYQLLRFGQPNDIEIETSNLDRARDFIAPDALDQYVYDHFLCDQWVASSFAEEVLSNWDYDEWKKNGEEYTRCGVASGFTLQQTVRQEGQAAHCWSLSQTVWHDRKRTEWLADCCLFSGNAVEDVSDAEVGHPASVGEHGYIAVEHPTGIVARGKDDLIRLLIFPGRRLECGERFDLPAVIWSYDACLPPTEQFHHFMETRSTRGEEILSFYDPYGHNDFGFGQSATERDFSAAQALASLEQIDRAKSRGLEFEYYVLDVGWIEEGGDFKTPRRDLFPQGFEPLVKELHARRMKFGLWFPMSFADWGIGSRPGLESSRIPGPLGHWPERKLNAHGLPVWDFYRLYSMCSEYMDCLEAGILHHIKESGLRLVKLDVGSYFSMAASPNGLPGKYSTYAMHSRLLEMAGKIKAANKDVRIIWYWGVRSPFILKNSDTVFESRLCLEGSNASTVPCWQFRDSAQRNIDLGVWNCPWIPPRCKDSLGIWLADTQWGNFMGAEDLSNSIRMELGRGHLMFPQVWGDLRFLSDEQLSEMGRAAHWLRKHREELFQPRRLVGNPACGGVYGYIYGQGNREYSFVAPQAVECSFDGEVHHFDLRVAQMAGSTCRVSLEGVPGKCLLVLAEAREKTGLLHRVEQIVDWPQVQAANRGAALLWNRICPSPDHSYVWKGSSWRYWCSEEIREPGKIDITFTVPERCGDIGAYTIQLGLCPIPAMPFAPLPR